MVSDVSMTGPEAPPVATGSSPPPPPAPAEATSAAKDLIKDRLDRIQKGKAYHKKAFKRMFEDTQFAAGKQWDGQKEDDDRYVCNIIQSFVRQRVASLYAKNPTVIAKRKERMFFAIWDESEDSLKAAMMATTAPPLPPPQMGMPALPPPPPDPAAVALMQDIQQGVALRQNLDRVARTLEIVFRQQLDEQQPDFKRMMKSLVRRVVTTGVGYAKLDFQRQMDVNPEVETRISDTAAQLAHIEALMTEMKDGDYTEDDKKAEELRISLKSLQEKPHVIVKEGLLIHFPRPTSIIIDPHCTQLEGFVGAGWIAEEFYLSDEDILEIYKVDVKGKGKTYERKSVEGMDAYNPVMQSTGAGGKDNLYCVYEVYERKSQSMFTICEGYDDGYLKEPGAPNVTLDRFWPYYALTFTDKEDEVNIFPQSSVRLLMHQQKEYNRAKEALRQHRIASRPQYANADGTMENKDMKTMEEAPAHAIIKMSALQPGQKVEDLIQMIKKYPIDPNTYETGSIFEDVQRVSGADDANFGATSGATATENTIAEDSRMSAISSNSDDMDDFIASFVKDAGHVLIMQLSPDTVMDIAGPGASWPTVNPETILSDMYLSIEAGSSGSPNKAVDVANFQKIFPLLIQVPGIRPDWMAKTAIKMLDSTIDMTDAYIDSLPSIIAQNAMAQAGAGQPPTGNPATDPASQGPQGANNAAPAPAQPGPGMAPHPGLRPQAGAA